MKPNSAARDTVSSRVGDGSLLRWLSLCPNIISSTLPERLKRFLFSNSSQSRSTTKSRGALPASLPALVRISCGNGDQSNLAPAQIIPSRVGAND
jgi:hypothetical protein